MSAQEVIIICAGCGKDRPQRGRCQTCLAQMKAKKSKAKEPIPWYHWWHVFLALGCVLFGDVIMGMLVVLNFSLWSIEDRLKKLEKGP